MTDETKKMIAYIRQDLKNLAVIQKENRKSYRTNQSLGTLRFNRGVPKLFKPMKNINGEEITHSHNCFMYQDMNCDYSVRITMMHILLNRLRGRKPHCGSKEADEEYLKFHKDHCISYDPIYQEYSEKIKGLCVYVLVNSKLNASQRMPQAVHVVSELVYKYKDHESIKKWIEEDKTIVILEADELTMRNKKISFRQYCCHEFFDSDLDNMLTAMTFLPMARSVGRKYLSNLPIA